MCAVLAHLLGLVEDRIEGATLKRTRGRGGQMRELAEEALYGTGVIQLLLLLLLVLSRQG